MGQQGSTPSAKDIASKVNQAAGGGGMPAPVKNVGARK
jgi:hypothetical protein